MNIGNGELKSVEHWCKQEFSTIDLSDTRLNLRFMETAVALAKNVGEPINQACGDWASAKATYRLFDNPKLMPNNILGAHQVQLKERIKEHKLIFAIQDTTYINFTSHPKTEGLGRIGSSKSDRQQGLVMHTTLGVSESGLALGILAQDIWVRPPTNTGKRKLKEKLPIEKKESFKWLQSLLDMKVGTGDPKVKVVMICDREADIYEFISLATSKGISFLIRAQNDRILGKNRNSNIPTLCLWEHMENQPILGNIELEVSDKNDPNKNRTAVLEIRASPITIQSPGRPPATKSLYRTTLSEDCHAVWVREIGCLEGQEPVEWMLLSSVPVTTLEEAIEKIYWYKMRWHIECFFRVLKSGCRIEACRLESADRLKNS